MKTKQRKLNWILRKVDVNKLLSADFSVSGITVGARKEDVSIDDLKMNWDSIDFKGTIVVLTKGNFKLVLV